MPKKIPEIVKCNSVDTLERELKFIQEGLALEETEETWDKISYSVFYFVALLKGGACDFPTILVPCLRLLSRPLNSGLNSERSRLSGAITDLITALSEGLGQSFDPLVSIFFPTLLGLATRSNKLFIARAKSAILAIVENTQLPSLIPHLRRAVGDKSASLRLVATDAVYACLNCYNPPDLEHISRAEDIEAVITCTARDANADIRKSSRKVFEAYKILLPHRVDAFIAPLTPTMKKYLDIKGHFPKSASSSTISNVPSTQMASSLPPVLSTASSQHPGHVRSASSTAIHNIEKHHREKRPLSRAAMVSKDPETVSSSRTSRKDNVKHDMGPPLHIPDKHNNRMPVTSMSWGPSITSDPAHRPPILRPSSNMDTAKSQASRPPLNTNAEQGVSSSASSNPSAIRSGAQRPQLNGVQPPPPSNSFKGPIRPQAVQNTNQAQENNEKAQVSGGARRAPMPPQPQSQVPVPPDAPKKSARRDEVQKEERGRTESRTSNKEKKARSKTMQPTQRPEKEKDNSKRQPPTVVSSDIGKDKSDILPQAHSSASNLAKSEVHEARDPKIVQNHMKPTAQTESKVDQEVAINSTQQEVKKPKHARSLTAPTLSQLARIKEKEKERSAANANTNTQRARKKVMDVKSTKPLNVNKKKIISKDSQKSLSTTESDKKLNKATEEAEQKVLAVSNERNKTDIRSKDVEDEKENATYPESIPLLESPKLTPTLSEPKSDALPLDVPEFVFTNTYDSPPRSQLTDHDLLNTSALSGPGGIAATPISSLVLSIKKGFDFTPYPVDDNSFEVDINTTLPFPQDDEIRENEAQAEENELDGLEFSMNGIGADGRIIESPKKKRDVSKEKEIGNYLTPGRNVFTAINA